MANNLDKQIIVNKFDSRWVPYTSDELYLRCLVNNDINLPGEFVNHYWQTETWNWSKGDYSFWKSEIDFLKKSTYIEIRKKKKKMRADYAATNERQN